MFYRSKWLRENNNNEMVNRLIDITDGDIRFDDKSIKDQNPVELRRSIGYVIQQIGLMPHMTIKENIVLVGTLLKWPKKRKNSELANC